MDTVIGCKVRGASHVRSNTVCQDYYEIIEQPGYTVMAVADGHGSSSCPYSNEGSEIAARLFCSRLEEYYQKYTATKDGFNNLEDFLRKEGSLTLAKQLERAWKNQVMYRHIVQKKREIPAGDDKQKVTAAIHHKYGTTLLGMMVTEQFVFAFQLGDGDITYVDAKHRKPLIQAEKFLGVETYSLSGRDAWKKAISFVSKRELHSDSPYMYMLSTDGMANSYISQEEFYKAAADYFALCQGKAIGSAEETDPSDIKESAEKEKDLVGTCENMPEQEVENAVVGSEQSEIPMEPDAKKEEETGIEYVKSNLEDWLRETSEQGCGDDITVVFYYHE